MSDEKKPMQDEMQTMQFDRKQLDDVAAKAGERIEAFARDKQAMTPPKPAKPKPERIVVEVPERNADGAEAAPLREAPRRPGTAEADAGSQAKGDKPGKKQPASKLPRWASIALKVLRYLIVPALCVAALIAGVYIGYVQIGGQESSEIWKLDTWKHLIDLIFKD